MKNVAIITGGDSGEYEISLKTADNIMNIIDKTLYNPYLIHMQKGRWEYQTDDYQSIQIDKNDFTLTVQGQKVVFDSVFIAIHGTPGENGKLQSYFEMLNIPYTGCDSFTSALTFNKFFCNITIAHFGIPVSPSVHYFADEKVDYKHIISTCDFPCFVKPCNSGSSVGITKVQDRDQLVEAITLALRYDNQFMVEKYISGKEVTCGVAVIEGRVKALAVTEVRSKKEYYDYEAKYTPGYLELVTPAEIDKETEQKVLRFSELIYRKLGCKGVVRVDYIISSDGTPYFLELNSIPGQTAMSIIPRQVQYLGINIVDFYSGLIEESFRNIQSK